jgi:cytoskeletal protein CcmA (bactofilin family)
MWTNKSSRIEVPPYAPPDSPEKTVTTAPIHVLKETEHRSAGPSAKIQPPSMPAQHGSHLGPTLSIKGEISGNEDLTVDGSLDGLIQMEGGKLTVGAGAKISADILAAEILVYGEVKGNLCARDRIEIKRDGSVLGELSTSRIMIEDGAYFKGSIEVNRRAASAVPAVERRNHQSQDDAPAGRVPNLMCGTPTLHLPSPDGKPH